MPDRQGEVEGQPNDEFGPKPLIDPSAFEVPEPGGKKPPPEPEFPVTDLPTQYLPGYHPTFPLPRPVPPQPQPEPDLPEWAKPQTLPPLGPPQPPDPAPTARFNPADPMPTARFGAPDLGAPQYGRIERQIPGVTQPRPPTVAEARARDKARRQAEIDAEATAAAAARKRRIMRGGVAVAGVAAIIGVGYLVHQAVKPGGKDTVAQCTEERNGQPVVVPDYYCSGGPGVGGFFYYGGHQYRYYYGGPAAGDGAIARGGSYSAPADGSIHTRGGSVIRGGFGSGGEGGGRGGGS